MKYIDKCLSRVALSTKHDAGALHTSDHTVCKLAIEIFCKISTIIHHRVNKPIVNLNTTINPASH